MRVLSGSVRPSTAVLFMTTGLVVLPLMSGCGREAEADVAAIPVRVMTVGAPDAAILAQDPTYSGVVMARTEAAVAFQVAGRMTDRRVEVGDGVVAGTVLATLDPTPYRLAADAARSSAAAAAAVRDQASGDVERNAPLAADRIVPAAQFDRLKTARDTAQARAGEAQSRLRAAQNDLGYTALRAPSSGVITEIQAEVGQYFAPGQVAFRIARPGSLEAVVDVPESVVASLRAGMPASVALLANDGASLSARVREIAPSADPATRTYRVRVTLDDPRQARMGMTARVRFDGLSTEGGVAGLQVPMSALFNQKDRPAVWVIKPDGTSLELRPVTVTAFAANGATVSAGLRRGDRIVTAGVHRIDAGQRVRIWDGRL